MGAPTGHWKASAKGANWLSPPRTRNLEGACVSESTDEMADFRRWTEHHVCAKEVKKIRFSSALRGSFPTKAC